MFQWNDILWQGARFYTWITLMWHRYITSNIVSVSDDEDDYPFAIVKDGDLTQVYYPEIEPTSYGPFIATVVAISDEKKFDLNLKEFFVDGNCILGRDFVRWYLKTHYRYTLDEDEEYSVHVIDHNTELVSLSPDEYIELNKDNYLKKSYED